MSLNHSFDLAKMVHKSSYNLYFYYLDASKLNVMILQFYYNFSLEYIYKYLTTIKKFIFAM